MAESTHTPGEWYAEPGDLHADGDTDPLRWSVLAKVAGVPFVPFVLATVENGAPGDTCDTERRNALLFAASKDLLAALAPVEAAMAARGVTRDALAAIVHDLPFRVRFTVAELLAVLDALAKARGDDGP